MFTKLMKIRSTIYSLIQRQSEIYEAVGHIKEALGRVEARQNRAETGEGLAVQEFKVYSQWGEDGIIQHLLRHVEIKNPVFVEFGVENYKQANTRFLLINNNWSGLVIDGSPDNVSSIKTDPIYWGYNLKAECAFITKGNINELLKRSGIAGDIGLLSVDIDGNDYWVWNEIEIISPRIVIIEYNSRFGAERAITVPYDAAFVRRNVHYSSIYFGASLRALVGLGKKKGYSFVGCNKNGVNAFFVRKDFLGELKELTVEEGYVAVKLREAHNKEGKLAYMNFDEEVNLLKGLPFVEVAD